MQMSRFRVECTNATANNASETFNKKASPKHTERLLRTAHTLSEHQSNGEHWTANTLANRLQTHREFPDFRPIVCFSTDSRADVRFRLSVPVANHNTIHRSGFIFAFHARIWRTHSVRISRWEGGTRGIFCRWQYRNSTAKARATPSRNEQNAQKIATEIYLYIYCCEPGVIRSYDCGQKESKEKEVTNKQQGVCGHTGDYTYLISDRAGSYLSYGFRVQCLFYWIKNGPCLC